MKWIMIFLLAVALFVRFYRLDVSSHFAFDESRDLVNMHQIWVEKKITLVGPISEDRSHANSSLTYYMLLPFAVIFNFDPIGPVIGSVFWGIITSGLMVLVIAKYNHRLIIPGSLLAAIWVPLVITSRWAWNPNTLMLWLFLGFLLQDNKNWWVRIASGVAFGLTIHHHNLAVIPIGLWVLYKRDWKIILGVLIALLPFVLFDLRHPPGIFITRMIDYNRDSVSQNPLVVLKKLPGVMKYFFDYVYQQKFLIWIGILMTFILGFWDLSKKSAARVWLVIWMFSIVPLALFSKNYHYFLPSLPFFIVWIFIARKGMGKILSYSLLLLMLIGSIFSISKVWHEKDWEGNLRIVRVGTQIIADQIKFQGLKNPNLAVLASPDIFPSGVKFRNMLLVNNIKIRAYEEYAISDNLFVVTKGDVETLRIDPAAEIMYARNGPVKGIWEIPETGWRVIQFNKY